MIPTQSGVRVGSDSSTAVSLQAAASKPIPSWNVSPIDLAGEPCATLFVDKTKGVPGETVNLTIIPIQQVKKLCVVGIVSTFEEQQYIWPIAIDSR